MFEQEFSNNASIFLRDFMRGYCPKCREYRSDNGFDAWGIVWHNNLAVCEKCGSVIDLWIDEDKSEEESE